MLRHHDIVGSCNLGVGDGRMWLGNHFVSLRKELFLTVVDGVMRIRKAFVRVVF